MGLANCPTQPILGTRDGNQMDMIGHQAVRPYLHSAFLAPIGHQFHIGRIVFVAKKRLLPTISTLGYVMWQTRNDQSSQPGHPGNLQKLSYCVNIGACPRNIPVEWLCQSIYWHRFSSAVPSWLVPMTVSP
jgi:hypothetical protein